MIRKCWLKTKEKLLISVPNSYAFYILGTASRYSPKCTPQAVRTNAEMLGSSSRESAFLLRDNSWTWKSRWRCSGANTHPQSPWGITLILLSILFFFPLYIGLVLHLIPVCKFQRTSEVTNRSWTFSTRNIQSGSFSGIWVRIFPFFFFLQLDVRLFCRSERRKISEGCPIQSEREKSIMICV